MHYEGNMIRPPSEANSILLQATVGCSHNKCTFCGTYRGERFKIKSDEIIRADIAYAARHFRHRRRLFICDGDALIIPQKRLLNMLKEIETKLPWITRVGVYANTKGLKMKTPEELKELNNHGLGIVYVGLETGDDLTLKNIRKGASAETMIQMGRKAKAAGLKVSVTVLLGIAGVERSQHHARETGKVLSAMDPNYVGALTLMVIPYTPLYEDLRSGKFVLPDPLNMLKELKTMLVHTYLSHGLFHANHASNYLPIRARLPKDKAQTIELIDQAISGDISLRPEYLRGL